MAVYENSRYLHTTIYNRLGIDSLVFRLRERHIFSNDDIVLHEWCEGDTLDGISFRYYGRSDLYWVILDCNPQYQTELDIQVGDLLTIPEYTEVVKLL